MIDLIQVSKIIKKNQVLKDITYTFEKGKIYGLYGPNGSGKTMILRMISGLIFPTQGEVIIEGKKLHHDISFPPSIGVIIENMELLPNLTAYENLKCLASIKKIASDEDINNALQRVGLQTEKVVKKYSLGMKQRLNVAQAIFEKPDIILLDEPTNALDDEGVQMIYKVLEEERSRGACIIMATHNKSDFSNICNVILKVSNGEIREVINESL